MISPRQTMMITWFLAPLLLAGTLAPALPETTNTPATLPPDHEGHLDPAFELAHQALQDQKNLAEATLPESMNHLVDQQTRNLRTTEELLAINNQQHEDDLHRAVTLAKAGTRWQAATLGLDWVEPVPLDGHSTPSPALLELADRHHVEPSTDQLEQVESLDDLDEPLRTALARFVDAFLALDTAARLAYQDADLSSLEGLQDPNEQQGILGDPQLHGGELIPGAILKDSGVDLTLVFPTRNQFLDAILDLHEALTAIPTGGCNALTLAPAFSISLGTCDDRYTQDVALSLDTGGNNRYHNNAGGAGTPLASGGCNQLNIMAAAALVDLGGGNNEYGDPDNPKRCGANGGGMRGVGFLLDLEGNDTYGAGNQGTNGGGLVGAGFLLDASGDDTYTAGNDGANGGGGAYGVGFLLDAVGDDIYIAGNTGTNGGGFLGGMGFLFDLEGDDIYTAGSSGTNGGGNLGVGYVFDGAGTDYYEDPAIPEGSCWDCSLVPKGEFGAQVDEALSVPDLQVQMVPIAKFADLGITDPETATITIEQGLLRASALGAFADLPIIVPLLSGEPHPDNLNQDLGVASTSYTHQQDVCIDGQCAFNVGASLGDDVKIGELWEAELRILLDGDELLALPFVEVQMDP